jgi:glutamate synthase domain-containing protein 2/glutamate synthase domain-containing protein 3
VCPYLALEIARSGGNEKLDANKREQNLVKALEQGLLKIMSKAGISVVRSYHSAKMFTAIGLGKEIIDTYFPGLGSPIGGIGIRELVDDILTHTSLAGSAEWDGKPIKTYQFKEHNKGTEGERHSMTNTRSKMIHELVRESGIGLDKMELYDAYLKSNDSDSPVNIRHLLQLKVAEHPTPIEQVQPAADILRTFGSGAMSFGAISAESQRDIFEAMREIGGRSNSGEGGENPYYFTDGITANIKQVASGRFGVTAQYLVTGDEIQIKVAQGAKPGEGGQLMGVKVNEDIARARHSLPNVDLISPPPLHDIYSIEDLKQLIYELKQVKPGVKVGVKLVAGSNIGTIAVGVAKAGADVIHISGADGGTGAATLSSMKHAGLPWELGLVEAHRALVENDLRKRVILRTDGGLQTGTDIVMAALLGADEFDFGKLLLVAEGCVMARICEKNTCPTGIATHDPKFKAKYKGSKDDVVMMLRYIAEDVRRQLSKLGVSNIQDIVGRSDLLEIHAGHLELINRRGIDLGQLLGDGVAPLAHGDAHKAHGDAPKTHGDAPFAHGDAMGQRGTLNARVVEDATPALDANIDASLQYRITTTDRAVLATLSGEIAMRRHRACDEARVSGGADVHRDAYTGILRVRFDGSAGQGFGAFLEKGIDVKLYGEANDSVGKSMSGGRIVIQPGEESVFRAEENAILGNCALYGATGGVLYVNGLAGDRFAVRNSGATAVVEGTGLHACEYMTNGTVVILGKTSPNIGAGMTGGTLFTYGDRSEHVNGEYVAASKLSDTDEIMLKELLEDYLSQTGSNTAFAILTNWDERKGRFVKWGAKSETRDARNETQEARSESRDAGGEIPETRSQPRNLGDATRVSK